MKHIHLNHCESTQDLLVKEYQNKRTHPILISTNSQSKGKGRGTNKWIHHGQSLAMSCTLEPNEILTLTPLEISVILAQFLKKHQINIELKWPNDLFYQQKKVGGILLNNVDSKKLIVGIGLNLGFKNETHHSIPLQTDQRTLSKEIYDFLREKRLNAKKTRELWNSLCIHRNQIVTLKDNGEVKGIFKGLGENGQALIEIENKISHFYTGSLFI